MNRRKFLTILGIAPATAIPLPKEEEKKDYRKLSDLDNLVDSARHPRRMLCRICGNKSRVYMTRSLRVQEYDEGGFYMIMPWDESNSDYVAEGKDIPELIHNAYVRIAGDLESKSYICYRCSES